MHEQFAGLDTADDGLAASRCVYGGSQGTRVGVCSGGGDGVLVARLDRSVH